MPELASQHKEIDLDKISRIAETGSHEWRILEAAKMYAREGLWVLPLRPNTKILPPKEFNITYGHASNKEATMEKWFGPDGKYKGWNIGIATGKEDGTFVLDVDLHGKSDGMEELNALQAKYEPLPEVPVQQTPGGGRHYLFLWQEHAASSTGKIAKSIDTRGGSEKACKGHIVVWPSIVDKKEYKWVHGGNRAIVPKWVMERMGAPWNPTRRQTGSRGNEYVMDEDLEQKLEMPQIRRMLATIDPNELSYDEWLRVGMSIKSQYPGEDGLQVWDQWSQDGERYESNECHIRWNGLDELGAIRIGTLFYYAKRNDWEPEEGDKHSNPLKEIVHELNREYAVVVVGGKLKILRERSNGYYDPIFGKYELLEKDAFRGMLQPFKVEVVNSSGKHVMVSKADIWLGDEERRSYPNGLECCPDGKVRPGVYNTWAGFSVEPRLGDCNLFTRHVLDVVCSGNKEHYDWLMDWCAFAVQYPGELPGTCIVMRGDEGTGKGTLADTIGQFFGPHYRHLIDNAHLLSNFNAHMMDATFVFADEITYGGEVKTAGKLKGMVTEQYLVGERKGIDATGYRNMIHLMIASNSEWVIPAGPNSRRWFVLDVANHRASDRAYFDAINRQLNNGGREALLHLLLTRTITSNLRKAPGTKALSDQAARTTNAYNTVVRWWTRRILLESLDSPDVKMENDHLDWPQVVKTSDLLLEYTNWCVAAGIRPVADYAFFTDLRKFGLSPTRPSINGTRIRALKIPSLEDAKLRLTKLGFAIVEDDDDSCND